MWTIEEWKKVLEFDLKREMKYLEEDIVRINKKEYYYAPLVSGGHIDPCIDELQKRVSTINKLAAQLSTIWHLNKPATK